MAVSPRASAPAAQTKIDESAPLYLVDGSGYIFRAYYAIQPLSTQAGLPTNALLGFTRMLVKLLRDVRAHYIAVTFDAGRETFRNEMYSDYKANRAECPVDLVPQMPYFRRIVQAMGIPCLEKKGFEADDILATLVRRFAPHGRRIVVVSGDKDLTQLVTPQIHVWDAMRDIMYTEAAVKEKFGVTPAQIRDYLALTGDTSDNVPGVRGIGPKTAQVLIQHFGSTEELIRRVHEVSAIPGLRGAKGVQEKLAAAIDELSLSKRLVTLDDDVEPYNALSDVEELAWQHPDDKELQPLFAELEFSSLLQSLNLPRRKKTTGCDDIYALKRFEIISKDTLADFVTQLAAQPAFAFDTETSSLDYHHCSLVGISFAWEPNIAYYLPLGSEIEPELLVPLAEARELLNPIFSDPLVKKVGVNLKFDLEVLLSNGFVVDGLAFDALLCAHLLNPDKRDYGLKTLARLHLDEEMRAYDEIVGDCEHIGQVKVADVAKYACHDAEASWCLEAKLNELLGPAVPDGPSLRKVFEEIEMPLVPVLAEMERTGIKVDGEFLRQLGEEFNIELARLQERIQLLAGMEFNLNSPKQLQQVLFEHLAIPTKGVKKTKSGYSTDASVLQALAADHEIVAALLEYREIHKLLSTYIDALGRQMDPETSRIHATFNQAVAATGRLSSSDPNLQNIPIRNPRGRRIRQAFIAEDGCKLLSVDYSQIELRVLAHLSGDPTLQDAFISGEDIHLRTAKELFGIAALGGSGEMRRIAKTINFGIIYGMGAFRLAREIGVTRRQAQEYIENYFARYPRVLEYFDKLQAEAEQLGFVTTMFGRRRHVQELDMSGRDAGYAGRSMINAPIQGTAAEIMKIAMIRLHRRLADLKGSARMVLQVHDELVVEVADSLVEEVTLLVQDEMEGAVSLAVPLKVDVRVGPNWGEV